MAYTYTGPRWPDILHRHVRSLSHQDKDIRRALDMYQGKYWSVKQLESTPVLTSFNLLFAIVESAVSALVPNNIRFSIDSIKNKTQWLPPDIENTIEDISDECDWRNEAVISLTDSVLTGRSILKVMPPASPDEDASYVSLRAVRPQQVFFDLTARRPSDIRWFAEESLIDLPTFLDRVRKRTYRLPPENTSPSEWFQSRAGAWPVALGEQASHASETGAWLKLYEVWDNQTRTMTVWAASLSPDDQPLAFTKFTPDKWACPYVLFNLNYNGENCLGLSEAQLCMDNIDAINRMLSWMMTTVRRQKPVTAYDARKVGEESVARLAHANPGDFVAVHPSPDSGSIGELFMASPIPTVSGDMRAMMDKLEHIVSYVSALADAARGQVTGARTATELALIESQQRTRLASRETRWRRAWAMAGALALWHMTGRKQSISDLRKATKLVAFNSTESNRAVLRETFDKVYAYCTQRNDAARAAGDDPVFSQDDLDKLFVTINGLPEGILEEKEIEEPEMEMEAEEPTAEEPMPGIPSIQPDEYDESMQPESEMMPEEPYVA